MYGLLDTDSATRRKALEPADGRFREPDRENFRMLACWHAVILASVSYGLFCVVDDQDVYRGVAEFEPQPEFFL